MYHTKYYTHMKNKTKTPKSNTYCVIEKLQDIRRKRLFLKHLEEKIHSAYKVVAIKLTMDLSQDTT